MAEKILQTRILNKIDTHENWLKVADTFVPKNGEICIDTITTTVDGAVVAPPQTLIKIGDGTSTWGDLNFLGGISADVYAWAKAATKPTYTAEEISGLDDYIAGEIEDTDTQYQIVKDGDMGIKLQSRPKTGGAWTDVGATLTLTATAEITTAIQALDAAAVTAGEGEIISEVSETDGIVSIKKRSLVAADIPTLTTAKLSDFATAVDGRIDTKVGDIGESADVAEFVTGSIDTAIGTLNLNAVTAGTGQVIGQIQQTDGAVTAQVKTLTADDIPAIPTSKVTNLDTTLAGKQDNLTFTSTFNPENNKVVLENDLKAAISGLSGAMHYVGESTTDPSTGTATVEGHEDWVAGDVVTYNAKEYVYDGENWRELGDESSYAVKGSIKNADIASDAAIDQSKIANLVTDLAAKATPADITSAIQALDKASTAVATGSKITAVEEVDGIINVTTGAIVAGDIPELPQTKITGLTTALAGKQDALTMDGTYNAESNKVATQSTVTNAIGTLDFDDTAVAHQFITEVNENNGVISVQRAVLTADDIPDLTASKITDLDTTISGAIDEAITTDGVIDEAISGAVTEAIAGVSGTVAAVENNFVTSISMTNGKLSGTVAQPTIANINGLQTALDAKANDAALATIAKTGNVNDLVQTGTDIIVLQCGSSTVNV